jgi:hypothetical protein
VRWRFIRITSEQLGRDRNPVEYHILKRHPGDTTAHVPYGLDYDRVPAESVIHWFRTDRPGQARGIPDIMPALPLFAQLRRFTPAVIAAAETTADFADILYTDAPANGEADPAEPFEPIELEQRALLTMPGGWKMSQLEAEQPATSNLRRFQVGTATAYSHGWRISGGVRCWADAGSACSFAKVFKGALLVGDFDYGGVIDVRPHRRHAATHIRFVPDCFQSPIVLDCMPLARC